MEPVESYKHLALVAALIFWTAAIYMVRKWPSGRHLSFSKHAAAEQRAAIIFGVAITVESILYYLFLFKWFMPTFQTPALFNYLITAVVTGHLITGLVPETRGLSRAVHWWVSYAVAFLFIPATYVLAVTETIPGPARIVAAVSVLYMLGASALAFFSPKSHNHYLLYQAVWIATLPLAVITAAYAR